MQIYLKYLIPIFFGLPIAIFSVGELEIPLSDIALAIGFIYLVLGYKKKISVLYLFLFLIAIISVMLTQLAEPVEYSLRPYLSVVFFLKPILGYFAGAGIVKRRIDVDRVMFAIGSAMLVSIMLIFLDVLINFSGYPRADSSLNGSILGLPQYATYGVNSAACFYFLSFVMIIHLLNNRLASRVIKISCVFGVVAAIYLILGSLSREVILTLLLFVVISIISRKNVINYFIALCVVGAGIFFFYYFIGSIIDSPLLEAKIAQISAGISMNDLNYISSGRIELYEVALTQLSNNPLFGNGFHGYALYANSVGFEGDLDGLSAHNQYLTALWKGGAFFFLLYFYLIFLLLKRSSLFKRNRSSDNILKLFYICVLVVAANLWDVLIIANFGGVFFFLLGVLASKVRFSGVSHA